MYNLFHKTVFNALHLLEMSLYYQSCIKEPIVVAWLHVYKLTRPGLIVDDDYIAFSLHYINFQSSTLNTLGQYGPKQRRLLYLQHWPPPQSTMLQFILAVIFIYMISILFMSIACRSRMHVTVINPLTFTSKHARSLQRTKNKSNVHDKG